MRFRQISDCLRFPSRSDCGTVGQKRTYLDLVQRDRVRTGEPRQVVDRAHLLHREEVQDALLLTLKLLRGVALMCMPPD
jgi:hypothetical protein